MEVAVDDQDTIIQDPRIGELIGERNQLSHDQINAIGRYQRDHKVRFGSAAIALGMANHEDVLWALSQQFNYSYGAQAGRNFGPELIVAADPFSDEAEVFRGVRSRLVDELRNENGIGASVAITSPAVGDGKTLFAANLSVAFSQLGGRTLIVDADLRTGRLHTLFGQPSSAGLSTMLTGRANASASALYPVEGLSNLFLLPVGTVPPNPLELVQSAHFLMLMRELRTRFNYIVVDTPAATHGSDARVIAGACDASLVLARKGASRMSQVQALLDGIRRGRSIMSGVVLNNF